MTKHGAVPGPASIEMIKRLVSFDTTSDKSNLHLIAYVREYLSSLGVESLLIYDEEKSKANLFATLGPDDGNGILLSGHTDVVTVEGQDWNSDPFSVCERDGRLYGRGTADMKSFIAVVLALVPEFLERGLKAPLHLAFSYDEEIGCVGVRRLLEEIGSLKMKAKACIVGEPTEMKVVTAHKGKKSVRCRVAGIECHSSLAQNGANAVEAAAELVARLRRIGRRFSSEGPFDRGFAPPHTTVQTGVIKGGTALNIVPGNCVFEFEIRNLPRDDPGSILAELRDFADRRLLPEMRAVSEETGFHYEEISEFPGLDTAGDAAVAELAKTFAHAEATFKVGFGTEAGLFHQAGIPTVVCGPGSINQAHSTDEFITLDQVGLCEAFLRRLMEHLCQSESA